MTPTDRLISQAPYSGIVEAGRKKMYVGEILQALKIAYDLAEEAGYTLTKEAILEVTRQIRRETERLGPKGRDGGLSASVVTRFPNPSEPKKKRT